MSITNNKDLLSYDDLMNIKNIIINRFNIEIEKIGIIEFVEQISKINPDPQPSKTKSLSNSFLDIYFNSNPVSAYSSRHIDYIMDKLSSSNIMTETILNISHCVSIELSVEEISLEKIYNTLIDGSNLIRLDPTDNSNLCFLSKDILSTYYVDTKVIRDILKSNFYLIVLNFIIAYFHETNIYKNTMDNEKWKQSEIKPIT